MTHVVIVGQNAFETYSTFRNEIVAARKATRGSEALPDAQIALNRMGFLEASIVKSNYGFSLRYASGLQNWGIICSRRNGHSASEAEEIIKAAKAWQAFCPERRFVRMCQGD